MGTMLTGKGLRWWELESTVLVVLARSVSMYFSHLPRRWEIQRTVWAIYTPLDIFLVRVAVSHSLLLNISTCLKWEVEERVLLD
jgi:hypothetical protein